MARIFWTKEEQQQLAERAFELRSLPHFTGSDLDCVRKAMEELINPSRHREIKTHGNIPWLIPAWKILTRELQTAGNALGPVKRQAVVPLDVPESAPPEVKPTVADISTSDLWMELGRRMTEMMSGESLRKTIREEVNATLERRLPGILQVDDVQVPVAQPKQDVRQVKLKVCVMGLLPSQKGLIEQEYKGRIDFLFFEKTQSLPKIKSTAAHYDHFVQMIKYSDQIKGARQIPNFHQCAGLLTQLRAFLDRQLEKVIA